jgi:hypothetical protein
MLALLTSYFFSFIMFRYGVQDRFGVLFFIPFCLILLGLSSLPVWRDEHILFTHEQANKRIYGYSAYFLSVWMLAGPYCAVSFDFVV